MVSVKSTIPLLTLISICLLATHTSAAYNGCCQSYMRKKLPFKVIRGYSVQRITEMCHINAIIFHTKKGKTCANPALDWVMDYVNRLRAVAQRVHKEAKQ